MATVLEAPGSSTTMNLDDSTRTTRTHAAAGAVSGSVCTDRTTHSDLSSEISSSAKLNRANFMGEFEVVQMIGQGKFSQVYAARHKKTGASVALKRVALFDIMDRRERYNCLNEVKIVQSLDHPNIIKYHDAFVHDNELIIVLEWAESGDLGQMLRQRREKQQFLAEHEVWSLFAQACAALRHMHERRMMHRDIKPSNALVTAAGLLKIGDLGLSRYFSSQTLAASSMVGTPYYMSPECIKSQPYDFKSDMWSLGCLLYELCVLHSPFHNASHNYYTLGKAISSCAYEPLPPGTPRAVRDLVAALLQADPKARPTAQQVHEYAAAAAAQTPLPTWSIPGGAGQPHADADMDDDAAS